MRATARATAREDSGARRNHALDFLHFIASGADGMVSPGRRTIWEWARA
jgi:hypothetical protein